MKDDLSDVPEKYRHLFEDDLDRPKYEPPLVSKPVLKPMPRIEKISSDQPSLDDYIKFKAMCAVPFLSVVHMFMQAANLLVIIVVIAQWNNGNVHLGILITILILGLASMVLTRIGFEIVVVVFRIYEEIRLTRIGIDQFNAKMGDRLPATEPTPPIKVT